MKIAFVLEDLGLGGAQRHTVALARALPSEFEVELISLSTRDEDLETGGLPVRSLGGRGLDPRTWRKLAAALDESKPALVIAINQIATIATAMSGPMRRGRAARAAVFHSTKVDNLAGWLRTGPFMALVHGFDALVYVSANQRLHWERLGLSARRVRTIRNGIAVQRFTPPTLVEKAKAKAALGIDPAAYVVGMTAMFRWEKNHALALEALGRVVKAGLPAHLLLLGSGPLMDEVKARAASLGLADHVTFAGARAEVAPVLAAYDVGLLTSSAIETLSLAALEIMAMGAPMVMTDIGGASEVVIEGESGFLVPVGDAALIAERLTALADPSLRQGMGEAARERMEREFGYGRMVADYAELFESLAAHG